MSMQDITDILSKYGVSISKFSSSEVITPTNIVQQRDAHQQNISINTGQFSSGAGNIKVYLLLKRNYS